MVASLLFCSYDRRGIHDGDFAFYSGREFAGGGGFDGVGGVD